MLKVAVITVSDRAYSGEYEDLSGPKIKQLILESGMAETVEVTVVPDDKEAVRKTLLNNLDKDFIFTTGGTGISPKDIAPDVTEELCERDLPGISEFLRRESYRETKYAVLSRGYCGIRGTTIIVNFPGSPKAAAFCTRLILPIIEHARKMVHGGKH